MDILNDFERAKVEAFVKDEGMFEAVKKVMFATVYSEGVVSKDEKLNTKNATFALIANAYSEGKQISNEELGAGLRAKFEGIHTVLNGFEQLKLIKSNKEEVVSPYNEAI